MSSDLVDDVILELRLVCCRRIVRAHEVDLVVEVYLDHVTVFTDFEPGQVKEIFYSFTDRFSRLDNKNLQI